MSIIQFVRTSACALFLSGCSIYPLPQDTAGVTTDQIVTNVRCQARRAVRRAFRDELDLLKDEPVAWVRLNSRRQLLTGGQLKQAIDDDRVHYRDLKIKDFIGIAAEAVQYYSATQVAYEFTLDLKENNTQCFSIDLIRQFLRRADKIGLSVTSDRTREVSRTFTVQESFLSLFNQISHTYCADEFTPNIIFPLTGNMPIYDLVRTYIVVNEFGILKKLKLEKGDFQGTEKAPSTPQMADTITFTTKLIGKNDPTIEYHPLGQGFAVAGLAFTNENRREDIHKVIVTITTTEVEKVAVQTQAGLVRVPVNPSAEQRRADAEKAIRAQRERNFQDAVISISDSLSRLNALNNF